MKRDDLRRWLLDTKVSMPARFVYIALTLHADDYGRAWPAVGRLATETGSSIRTVRRALRELEAFGEVAASVNDGSPTIYRISDHPGHSDRPTPATVAGPVRSNSTRTPAKSDPNPGHSDRQKELKDVGRSAPALPDDPVATPDPQRNVAGVHAARAAKREAMRSDAQ